MNIQDWRALLPDHFSPDSRAWVYQSDRQLNDNESKQVGEQLYRFYTQWISHNRPVKGWAGVLFNRFIVFIADDTMDRLCGSAVDNSIRLVKDLEAQYDLKLLDRTLLAFVIDDHIESLSLRRIPEALETGKIDRETLYFNNTITTRSALDENWLIKVKDSWLVRKFLSQTTA
jgi:hypothetical protein